MAIEKISHIRASGQTNPAPTYNNLSDWQAAFGAAGGVTSADLVANDEIAVAEVYNDWPGDGLNNTVTITGWTTDLTRNVIIRPAAGEGHDGTPNTGFRMYWGGNFAACINANQAYTRVQGLQVKSTASGGYGIRASSVASVGVVVDGCIVYECAGIGIRQHYGSTAQNCAAIDCGGVGFENNLYNQGCYTYNCVAAGNAKGFVVSISSLDVRNCVAYNNTTEWDAASTPITCTNNASGDYSGSPPPGTSPYASDVVPADFVDTASNDYHIETGSGLHEAGADLSSIFTEDIDGDTWQVPWSIGFDQPAAATPILSNIEATSITTTSVIPKIDVDIP